MFFGTFIINVLCHVLLSKTFHGLNYCISCAFWPDGPCDGETNYTEPCNAPKTIDVPLITCDHRINRDLHAESHAIAWMGIVGCGIIILFVFIMQRTFSKHSYLQTMWIREYRKVRLSHCDLINVCVTLIQTAQGRSRCLQAQNQTPRQ